MPSRTNPAIALLGLDDLNPNSLLSPSQAQWDQAVTGADSQFLQRGGYYIPEAGRAPIRTVIPTDLMRTMPLEQQMKLEEAKTQQLEREARTRGVLLQQRMQNAEHQYKLNTIAQSEELMAEIPNGVPGSADYLEWRAGLARKYPLGIQAASVQKNLGLLDGTHEEITKNDQILNRTLTIKAEAERQADIDEGRKMAVKIAGTRGLAQYEDELKRNPNTSPLGFVAKLAETQDEQNYLSTLRGLSTDEESFKTTAKKFYAPELDVNGQPTGKTVFNATAAKDYIDSYPTESSINRVLTLKAQLREKNYGKIETWPEDAQREYRLLDHQLSRYESMIGAPATTPQPKTSIPKTPNASLLFGK